MQGDMNTHSYNRLITCSGIWGCSACHGVAQARKWLCCIQFSSAVCRRRGFCRWNSWHGQFCELWRCNQCM